MFSNTKVLERERSKKMEDYKNITPPSSPTFSFSGNNENLNESKRNSEQISKKPFMSPTISTASKSVTPNKKRILAERKPPKMGTISSSTTPTKSLSKISTFFSEDETFVPDSTTKPYDPVTNYLSPRPKFLRYNPNRKRKLVLQTQAKSGSTTTSSSGVTVSPKSVSLDSQSSCSAFETTGNPDQEIVEDEDEEEVGWKWVLLNWFFVIFAVVFCTKYISSMNNNPEMIEFQDFGNLTFGIVSLRSLDSGYWVSEFDAKYLYEFVSEIEENQVPFSPEEGNLNYEIDYAEHFRDLDGFKQDIGEYDAFPETIVEIEAPIDGFKQDIGEYDAFPETIVEIEAPIDGFKQDIGEYDAFPETIVEIEAPIVAEPKFEGDEVKNLVFDATIAAPKPNVVGEEEKLVDFKEKIHDLAAKEVEIAGDDHEVVGDNHENKEVDIVEIGEKQWRLTKMEYIWVGGLTVASYVGFLVVLFIRKWKKAFTMSGYSKRKRNSEAVKEESGRSFREDLELHNCLAVNVESMQKTPTAKLVGEVDFGGQFSGAVKMQGRDGSVFSVPDERSTKKSKVSSSSSTSTSTSEDGKEEGTALRRSQRLRKKGVASP
ncbi:uncharacterized protein [Spinacia oleracea]|uniref:Uncharacterized protein n=1 Tax=Spinacia oleracea TaxID=3562 RepID=A0A9R0IYE0_SPIOL|nr:uncharacterized protein LOC110796880 [Spinacia oleracea]